MKIWAFSFLAIFLSGFTEKSGAASLPEYQLHVGDEITYQGQEVTSRHGKDTSMNQTFQLWVIGTEAAGWKVVTSYAQAISGGKINRNLAVFQLRKNGERIPGPYSYLAPGIEVSQAFPRLPQNTTELAQGWKETPYTGVSLSYSVTPTSSTSSGFQFLGKLEEPTSAATASQGKSELKYQWNQTVGLLERVSTDFDRGKVADFRTKGSLLLLHRETKDHAWIEEFSRETERYGKLVEATWGLIVQAVGKMSQASADIDEAKRLVQQALAGIVAVEGKIQLSPLTEQLASLKDQCESTAKAVLSHGAAVQQLLGKSTPSWKATDTDGNVHTASDYLGKVVVLDFWFAGCGPCVAAMPTMKRLVTAFQNKPVAVLGMDTEDSKTEASAAKAALQLNFPVLLAEDARDLFEITGTPTEVVIDRKGVVRSYHLGAQSFDELSQLISRLLAER